MKLVGNQHHRFAVLSHIPQHIKKFLCLLGRQHRRRLVQDQNISSPEQSLNDLQRLFLGDAHLIYLLIQIQIKAIFFTDLPGPLPDSRQVIFFLFVQSQSDIFQSRKHVHQFKMLMDHSDSQIVSVFWGTDLHPASVYKNFSFIRIIDAGDHVHQSCLSASVFAQQRQDLAFLKLQGDIPVSRHSPKCLGHMSQFNGIFHGNRPPFPHFLLSRFSIKKREAF